jgi:hypothetical protein
MTTVNVTTTRNTVQVVEGAVTTVRIVTAGPQGPPGEAAQGYRHNQTTPSSIWTITHNLGYMPSVELLSAGSQEVEGDVLHINQNVTVAYFTTPIAGYARLI